MFIFKYLIVSLEYIVIFGSPFFILGTWFWFGNKATKEYTKEIKESRELTSDDKMYARAKGWRVGWKRAVFACVVVAFVFLVMQLLFAGGSFSSKLKNGVSSFIFFGIFCSIAVMWIGNVAENIMYPGIIDAYEGGGQAGIKKMETVDNMRNQVLAALGETNRKGPLVAFRQMFTKAEVAEENARRKEKPFLNDRSCCSDEDRGVILGAPGAGKTTFLVAQLVEWMTTGRSFVATDIKPEIWSILKENGLFERFGYTDWVINPTCKDAHRFNLFAEIEDDADLNEVLAVIIPPGEGDGAVFEDNARRLLKAILSHLDDKASLPAARDFMMEAEGINNLLEILKQSPKKSVQRIAYEIKNTSGNERLMSGILTAMAKAFVFIDDERINDAIAASDFKMKKVLSKPRQAVFLQFEQKYKASLETLFGATVAYTLRVLQANASKREDAVFVALDEIINAAPIPKLAASLNTMRSARMPLMMYLQSLEGLNKLYGPGSAELFLAAADLKVIFRINEHSSAEYVSSLIGDTEQRNFGRSSSVSQNTGGTSGTQGSSRNTGEGNSSSMNYSTTTGRIIDPADILKLEKQIALVLYRGPAGRFAMPSYWQDYPMPNRAAEDARPQKHEAEEMAA